MPVLTASFYLSGLQIRRCGGAERRPYAHPCPWCWWPFLGRMTLIRTFAEAPHQSPLCLLAAAGPLSAAFATLTAIFAKVYVENVNSDFARELAASVGNLSASHGLMFVVAGSFRTANLPAFCAF